MSKEPTPLKGAYGGVCNRGECDTFNARWWNKSTRKYYCQACAFKIMRWPENADLLQLELTQQSHD